MFVALLARIVLANELTEERLVDVLFKSIIDTGDTGDIHRLPERLLVGHDKTDENCTSENEDKDLGTKRRVRTKNELDKTTHVTDEKT